MGAGWQRWWADESRYEAELRADSARRQFVDRLGLTATWQYFRNLNADPITVCWDLARGPGPIAVRLDGPRNAPPEDDLGLRPHWDNPVRPAPWRKRGR
ncbi:MAG TPA: hypothetical protein VF841_17265 [Anaeromyxobacter sp.]